MEVMGKNKESVKAHYIIFLNQHTQNLVKNKIFRLVKKNLYKLII